MHKLKYSFRLFAINGENSNSLDITEFELMMKDLCVSFTR